MYHTKYLILIQSRYVKGNGIRNGICILELSKVLIYEFHYDYIKKYDNKSRLLFTDTDSAIYEIKTERFYADFSSNKEMKAKSKYHDDSIKLVIRKMKDETENVAVEECVVLKPKMYSFLVDNNEHKKAKGVNKNIVATNKKMYY